MSFMNLEEPTSYPVIIFNALEDAFSVKNIRINIEEFVQFCGDLNYPS